MYEEEFKDVREEKREAEGRREEESNEASYERRNMNENLGICMYV